MHAIDRLKDEREILNRVEVKQPLSKNTLNRTILEDLIIYFTNRERIKKHLPPCRKDETLRILSYEHSRKMASRGRIFHNNLPEKKLIDSFSVIKSFVTGENVGVDYFLKIASIPFIQKKIEGKIVYIRADDGSVIRPQTHEEFAKNMVKSWMKSEGHSKNILNKNFNRIGIGIAVGKFNGLDAIYVTQTFVGPLKKIKHH